MKRVIIILMNFLCLSLSAYGSKAKTVEDGKVKFLKDIQLIKKDKNLSFETLSFS